MLSRREYGQLSISGQPLGFLYYGMWGQTIKSRASVFLDIDLLTEDGCHAYFIPFKDGDLRLRSQYTVLCREGCYDREKLVYSI